MNLKEKFTGLIVFVVIILGFIATAIGMTSSPKNWLLIAIGFIILFVMTLYFKKSIQKDLELKENAYQKYINELKSKADRVIISLDKAVIQEKKYYYKKTVVEGDAAAINFISGYAHQNEETIESISCDVKFKIKHHKRTTTLKASIPKGETSVRMHFYLKKQTFAYINPFDPDEYYIDLEFMEDE